MFLNEAVSKIDDFWFATNVNSTARTTQTFINNNNNNNNNNNCIENICLTYWRSSDSLCKILRSLKTIMHNHWLLEGRLKKMAGIIRLIWINVLNK